MSEDTETIDPKEDEYVTLKPSDVIKYNGFDEALVGVGSQLGGPPVAIYDFNKIIEIMKEQDESTADEAVEKFKKTLVQMSYGIRTPMIIYPDQEEG